MKRLREETAAREQKDREAQIAKEAADKARQEAEDKAQRERLQEEATRKEKERQENEAFQAQQIKQAEEIKKIREENERADKERQEAEQRQKDAEKKLADEKEKNRLATARAYEISEANKKIAADKAIEDERIRVQKQNEKLNQERIARENDQAHKKRINNDILIALVLTTGISDDQAKAVIIAIVKGEIPNTAILY